MLERFTTQYCRAKLGRVSFLFHFMKNSFFEVTRLFTFVSQKNINLFFLQNKWHWKKMRQRIIIAYTWQWCWTCSCNMTPVMNFLLVELVSDGSLSGTNIVGCNGLHWKLLTMCYPYFFLWLMEPQGTVGSQVNYVAIQTLDSRRIIKTHQACILSELSSSWLIFVVQTWIDRVKWLRFDAPSTFHRNDVPFFDLLIP